MNRVRTNEPIVLEHKDGITASNKVAWTWFMNITIGDRFREVIPNDPQPGEPTFLGSCVFTKISETRARNALGETAFFDPRKNINFTHTSIRDDDAPHDEVCRCAACCAKRGGK